MRKPARALFLLFLGIALSAGILSARPINYIKALEVSGESKLLLPEAAHWAGIKKGTQFISNTKLKTGPKSAVDICFDWKLENAARLDENSRANVLTILPAKIFLERGSFFIYREGDVWPNSRSKDQGTITVATNKLSVDVKVGGCIVAVSGPSVIVKVFSDKVEILNSSGKKAISKVKAIHEGFKFIYNPEHPEGVMERMKYEDYADWQIWIKKLYEKKDRINELSVDKLIEQGS